MIRYPGRLDEAVANWLAQGPGGGMSGQGGALRQGVAALSARYHTGGRSGAADLAPYLVTRLPATFAVNAHVLSEVASILPVFAPVSLRDVGAGPGTASWAAAALWPSLQVIEQIEQQPAFASLAATLNRQSAIPALEKATVISASLRETATTKADLVIASYVLAELPEADAAGLGRHLWQQAERVLILIEPGTPKGFARLKSIRLRLLGEGAHVVGPCTHAKPCPLEKDDWCHFKQRVQRSRSHMQAKGAVVPYEDEPYAWLALSRQAEALPQGRIIGPVARGKTGLDFPVCQEGEVRDIHVASRDKATYKRLKKSEWGDAVSVDD